MSGVTTGRGPTLLVAALAAALALGLGWMAPGHPVIALGLGAAVLGLGISALQRAAIPLLCMPALFVAYRLSFGGIDLSISDLALGGATLVAVAFARRPLSEPMRNLLWLAAIYQTATLFTVVANPYPANAVEWVHAGVLVAGALLVGWAVGREGQGRAALWMLIGPAVVLATWVIIVGIGQIATGNFEPVYLPFRMHKNFLGTMIAITALIAYIRPAWSRIGPRTGLVVFWWLIVAVGFTQSRQAVVGLAVALTVLVLRTHTDRRRSKLILLAIVPALVVVLTLVRDQVASGNVHNSYFTRLSWFQDSIDLWQSEPLVGVGLRWWYTERFAGGIQPPNAELEVLTSAGLVGLIGFLVLMIGSVVVLWRVPPAYGLLAALAVLSRFVQGQLDLFWVAAQTSLPFLIAGICLGMHARASDGDKTADEIDALVIHPSAVAGGPAT